MSEAATHQDKPPRQSSAWIGVAIFFASSLVGWLALINDDWGDAYLLYSAAERIEGGQVPYRDFFICWGPGAPLFVGICFKLLGHSIAVIHLLQGLHAGAMALLGWLIARRVTASAAAYCVPIVALAITIVGSEGLNHMCFSTLLAMVALLLALHAERGQRLGFCVAAGAFAAAAGMCTLPTGAWMGIALLAAALTADPGRRLRWMLGSAAGGIVVLVLSIGALALLGALGPFIYDTFTWNLERYAPFHAGIGWGAWLPPWEMLVQIPWPWKPTWAVALLMIWGIIFVLPCSALLSFMLWLWKRPRIHERGLLAFAALALLLASYPHSGPMRVMRLGYPAWILLIAEIVWFFSGTLSPKFDKLARLGTPLAIAVFALVLPLQWSYRHQLIELKTERGTALVRGATADEYKTLQQFIRPGARASMMPEIRPSAWMHGMSNPTPYDSLMPMLFTPEQLTDACQKITAAGYPPVLYFHNVATQALQVINEKFKPARFTQELANNPVGPFIAGNYQPPIDSGGIFIFRKIKK